MGAELTQALALGVGASGALVQIADSLVRYEAGVTHSEGRSDAFRPDTPPGTFTVTLDNYDGRFTPDNTAAAVAAGYSQALSEGSAVSWSRGGKLWAGTVRGFEPADEWGLVTLTCDDALGTAARVAVNPGETQSMVASAAPYLWWPLDDQAGAPYARSMVAGPGPITASDPAQLTFGLSVAPYLGTNAILASGTSSNIPSIAYPSGGDLGWWGLWVTVGSASTVWAVTYGNFPRTSGVRTFFFEIVADTWKFNAGPASVSGPAVDYGTPTYLEVHVRQGTAGGTTTMYVTPYVNGVALAAEAALGSYAGTAASDLQVTPTLVNAFSSSCYYSNLSLTKDLTGQEISAAPTEADALTAIARRVSVGVASSALSTAPVAGYGSSGSALDLFNAVVETEQGYIFSTTTGTLTAPTTVVTVRERTRPPASSIASSNTFDAITEIKDVPRFLRDLTYTVESYTASGPTGNSATYTDSDLIPRVGTASDSGSILNTETVDLYGWAADRVVRGANIGLRAVSIEIDSLTTPTDRSADLLALKQGDRIRIANIPSGPTGFTTWDGWIIGIKERYVMADSGATNTFEFLVTPVLPDTGIYNTSVYDSAIYAF